MTKEAQPRESLPLLGLPLPLWFMVVWCALVDPRSLVIVNINRFFFLEFVLLVFLEKQRLKHWLSCFFSLFSKGRILGGLDDWLQGSPLIWAKAFGGQLWHPFVFFTSLFLDSYLPWQNYPLIWLFVDWTIPWLKFSLIDLFRDWIIDLFYEWIISLVLNICLTPKLVPNFMR